MIEFLSGLVLFLFWFFIDVVGYFFLRLALPVLSLGRAYVHPLGAAPGQFNRLGYRRDERGRIVVEKVAAGSIGFAVIVIVFLAVILATR
jgi:hypothetical protein